LTKFGEGRNESLQNEQPTAYRNHRCKTGLSATSNEAAESGIVEIPLSLSAPETFNVWQLIAIAAQ
jgi:hypothetical protein